MKYIKLLKNGKIPIAKGFYNKGEPIKNINTNNFNVGLLAGENNLIILDIDVKDEGLIEWNNYIAEYGEPNTAKQLTQSGGFHYIFKESEETNQLKNKSKYRNKGIDIRKGRSGYIVCEPSTIDGKKYKFIKPLDELTEMPETLISWLLEHENKFKNDNLIVILEEDKIKDVSGFINFILDFFKEVSSREWFNITCAIKSLLNEYNSITEESLIKVWKKWSKKQPKYDKENNLKIWKQLQPKINFNYIIKKINKTQKKDQKIPLCKTIKPYEPLQNINKFTNVINMSNNYIYDDKFKGEQFDENTFNKYDSIIIKSTTGTGKTSNTAKHINTFLNKNIGFKVLSIVNLISLADQQEKTFNDNNINIKNYQDKDLNIDDDNIIICLNSLTKFQDYQPQFFNNYIVYIDEITTLMTYLTSSTTLNNNLKKVYIILNIILRNCHKLIMSDAEINDNIFNFIEDRKGETIFINNSFQKYKDIPCIQFHSEDRFLDKVKEKISKSEPFLFGCDSRGIVEDYYNECIKNVNEEEKKKFIVISKDEPFKIKDVNEQFKNKYVFFSPSITTGIDFSINNKQDVFLYINGKSIGPRGSFQQLTRTRNINKAYIYIRDKPTGENNVEFNDIYECKNHYIEETKVIEDDKDKLKKMCLKYDEELNEMVFNENKFFKLFVYNEYNNDIFKSNSEQHFKNILKQNGFILTIEGKTRQGLGKATNKTMKEDREKINEEKLIEHVEKKVIHKKMKEKIEFINIQNLDKETILTYKDVILDDFLKDEYLSLIAYFRSDDYINKKVNKIKDNLTDYKTIHTRYYKIQLLKEFEKDAKIKPLDFAKPDEDENITINEKLFKKINCSFRSEQKLPKTKHEAINYYIKKIESLFGKLGIINTTKERKMANKERKMITSKSFNVEQLKYYFDLHYYSEPTKNSLKYNEYLLTEYKDVIKTDDIIIDVDFVEDDNEIDADKLPDPNGLDFGLD